MFIPLCFIAVLVGLVALGLSWDNRNVEQQCNLAALKHNSPTLYHNGSCYIWKDGKIEYLRRGR